MLWHQISERACRNGDNKTTCRWLRAENQHNQSFPWQWIILGRWIRIGIAGIIYFQIISIHSHLQFRINRRQNRTADSISASRRPIRYLYFFEERNRSACFALGRIFISRFKLNCTQLFVGSSRFRRSKVTHIRSICRILVLSVGALKLA